MAEVTGDDNREGTGNSPDALTAMPCRESPAPGSAAHERAVRTLSPAECYGLLEAGGIGRSWPRAACRACPVRAEGLDWFAGMTAAGAAEYRAAATGRAALEAHLASAKFDPEDFTWADHAALSGPWSWMGNVVTLALETDRGGIVDDDLAYVSPWGFDPREIAVPVLVVHGAQDRLVPSSHATWLAQRCRTAELWLPPNDGHVSILNSSVMALDWLCEHASRR
jgi:pimeloyl-ACP methyl ester carboxylesterase